MKISMDDNQLAKIARNANQIDLQNVGTKIGHQHDGRTDTLDKIQDVIL